MMPVPLNEWKNAAAGDNAFTSTQLVQIQHQPGKCIYLRLCVYFFTALFFFFRFLRILLQPDCWLPPRN